ncbi:unnamed protein product [Miscanthus lutarioriparius]|uniref:AP2/ERF domain-containing protein n=1 Tax=Miscanthus lutarioriparius TaxID=422564 RepID=A0A811SCP4_9POAL|nr:unnamed protein product [Miscanthus lutarioriparius]
MEYGVAGDYGYGYDDQQDPPSSGDGDEYATVLSAPPKHFRGRTKFRETRHPVYRGVRRRGPAGRWVCELAEDSSTSSSSAQQGAAVPAASTSITQASPAPSSSSSSAASYQADAAAAMYGGEYAYGAGMELDHSYYYDDGMVCGSDWQSGGSGWHTNMDGDDDGAGDMTLWSYY